MKMKSLSPVLAVILLIGCASYSLNNEDKKILNSSALYDPPAVTLIEGVEYQFSEGKITGRGQKFYSQYETTKKLIEGFKEK